MPETGVNIGLILKTDVKGNAKTAGKRYKQTRQYGTTGLKKTGARGA
jgi:hypothetical protein